MLATAVAPHREQPSMGARRLALQLQRKGFPCGRKLARRLMIEAKLRSASPGPHSSTRPRPGATPAPNLLEQEQPSTPNRVWTSDLTQLQVGSGLMHAAVIIDLNSRLVVGCRLSNTADAESCLNALADTCRVYGCPAIFHSDKGSQFTSRSFRSELRRRRIKPSMIGRRIKPSMIGRRGWKDNVFVERFIWRLKTNAPGCGSGTMARGPAAASLTSSAATTASVVSASCRVALPPRRMACQLKLLARSVHLLVASSVNSNLLPRTELSLVPYFITLLSKLKAPSQCALGLHRAGNYEDITSSPISVGLYDPILSAVPFAVY